MLFRLTCLPSNKSDKVKQNWKSPTVFILDNENLNPLGYTNCFKSVGAVHCFNCPSASGGISGCCHIGFLMLALSAPFALENISKPVKWVNLKNQHDFLHPNEAVEGNTKMQLAKSARISAEKRPNDVFYFHQFDGSDKSQSDQSQRINEQVEL